MFRCRIHFRGLGGAPNECQVEPTLVAGPWTHCAMNVAETISFRQAWNSVLSSFPSHSSSPELAGRCTPTLELCWFPLRPSAHLEHAPTPLRPTQDNDVHCRPSLVPWDSSQGLIQFRKWPFERNSAPLDTACSLSACPVGISRTCSDSAWNLLNFV